MRALRAPLADIAGTEASCIELRSVNTEKLLPHEHKTRGFRNVPSREDCLLYDNCSRRTLIEAAVPARLRCRPQRPRLLRASDKCYRPTQAGVIREMFVAASCAGNCHARGKPTKMQNSQRAVFRRSVGFALPFGAIALAMVSLSSIAEPKADAPLSQQTFVVVQATGIDTPSNSTIDVHQPLTLKEGQILVLRASSGQLIEVEGPYQGKPIDHYALLSGDATMGYNPHSSAQPDAHRRCVDPNTSHPPGGPNPDETAGPENQAKHCH